MSRERRLCWALGVGVVLFVAELSVAFLSGSLALLADSGHVFLDVFALGLAYLATRLVKRRPDRIYTYGRQRAEVLAAAINALLLVFLAGFVLAEALSRLRWPRPVLAEPFLAMAGGGLLGNLLIAFLLGAHEKHDLNMRAAFLHVLGDALGSLAALLAAVGLFLFGRPWVDSAASLFISGILIFGAVRLLRRAGRVLAEGVPEGLSLTEIAAGIAAIPGVVEVHDLHVWSLTPRFPVLTAHVVLGDLSLREADRMAHDLRRMLRDRFGIEHVTLQMEARACPGPSCNGREEKQCSP
jgi:cobalt-zinc-cadmium efflux system protein